MILKAIAAIGKNRELGKNNDLLWHLPKDLKFFRQTTKGHPVVMGKNTWHSLKKRLPDRTNIIISQTMTKDDLPDQDRDEVQIFPSIETFQTAWQDFDGIVFCIGGSQLYRTMLPEAQEMILTEVNDAPEADVYFPPFDKDAYTRKEIGASEDNGIQYTHVLYTKKVNQ